LKYLAILTGCMVILTRLGPAKQRVRNPPLQLFCPARPGDEMPIPCLRCSGTIDQFQDRDPQSRGPLIDQLQKGLAAFGVQSGRKKQELDPIKPSWLL
jgi:hypothetical protein